MPGVEIVEEGGLSVSYVETTRWGRSESENFGRHLLSAVGAHHNRAITVLDLLAEREGFEPSAEENPRNGLAGRPVQPLQHLS